METDGLFQLVVSRLGVYHLLQLAVLANWYPFHLCSKCAQILLKLCRKVLSIHLGEELRKLVADYEAAQNLVQLSRLLAENELFDRQFY